jgi:hypothetical protein
MGNWAAGTIQITCNTNQQLTFTSLTLTGSTSLLGSGACLLGGTVAVSSYTLSMGSSLNGNSLTFTGNSAALSGTITAVGSVTVGNLVTVFSGTTVGNGGPGTVTLDGCTVQGGAFIAASAICTYLASVSLSLSTSRARARSSNYTSSCWAVGPAVASTTTLGGGLTLATLQNWAGTVRYTGSGVLTLTAAVVTNPNARFIGATGATLAGQITVNAGNTLTFLTAATNAATSLIFTGSGSVINNGLLNVPSGSVTQVQGGFVGGSWPVVGSLQLRSGVTTVSNNFVVTGAGSLWLDAVTVNAPLSTMLSGFTGSLSTSAPHTPRQSCTCSFFFFCAFCICLLSVAGPSFGNTVTFTLTTADFTLAPPMTGWAGTLTVSASVTLSLVLPTGTTLSGTSATLGVTGAGAVAGVIQLGSTTLAAGTVVVANSRSLTLQSSSSASVSGTFNPATGGTVFFNTGIILANACTLGGAGTVVLTGCTVNPLTTLSTANICTFFLV